MSYTTQATDPYYLRKVRQGLITPVNPQLSPINDSDKPRTVFIKALSKYLWEWVAPSEFGYWGINDSTFWNYVKKLDEYVLLERKTERPGAPTFLRIHASGIHEGMLS